VKFIDQLDDVTYATDEQIAKEHWHVEGLIKTRTNQKLKFDLSPIKKFKEKDFGKIGHFKSKSDKIVFDFKDSWILIDTQELHEHIEKTNKKDLNLNELLDEFSWNIIINK
jgi:hypothetical protein